MKKLLLFTASLAIVFSSCKRRDTDPGENPTAGGYPTKNLTVEAKKRVLVQETTGTWCQYCPNGAEQLIIAKAKFGADIIPISSHTGDDLESPDVTTFLTNFPTSAVPNFYVDTAKVENYNQLVSKIDEALTLTPKLGVTHAVRENDTAYIVYPKIQVFEDMKGEVFFVESYLVFDEIEAREYPGVDLNQVSSVATVSTGSGATPTRWVQNAAQLDGTYLVTPGDSYYHEAVLWAAGANTPDWGLPLSEVNPFGVNFTKGDIFGTEFTPIKIAIPKASTSYGFPADISFTTIVWRLASGNTQLEFVNGYTETYGSVQ